MNNSTNGMRSVASEDLPPATRNTDPRTSAIAEREITESGVRKNHLERVVSGVNTYIGYTASELAEKSTLTKEQITKRLSDGRAVGALVNGNSRISNVSGREELTWYPDKDLHLCDMEILKKPCAKARVKTAIGKLNYSTATKNEIWDAIKNEL